MTEYKGSLFSCPDACWSGSGVEVRSALLPATRWGEGDNGSTRAVQRKRHRIQGFTVQSPRRLLSMLSALSIALRLNSHWSLPPLFEEAPKSDLHMLCSANDTEYKDSLFNHPGAC